MDPPSCGQAGCGLGPFLWPLGFHAPSASGSWLLAVLFSGRLGHYQSGDERTVLRWVDYKTPPLRFWKQKCSGAPQGLSVCCGGFRSHSRVLSPRTSYDVRGPQGHPHAHSAGPGLLVSQSSLPGAPWGYPRAVPGGLSTVCIHERSGGLLHCT